MSTEDCLESMPLDEDGLGGLRKPLEGLGDDDKLITSNGDAADDDGVGHNDLKLRPEFDRGEAEAALASMSLASLSLTDGHLVVMRDSFDVRVAGEPYHALMLLLDVRSGRYMARIWNRTEFRGEAVTLDQLTEACRRHFFSGRPCVGYPEDEDEQGMHEFLVSQTPVPRKISKACHRLLNDPLEGDATYEPKSDACPECLKLKDSKAVNLAAAAHCKVEIMSDGGEGNGANSSNNAPAKQSRKTRRRGGNRGPRKQYKEEPDWNPQWDGDGNLVPGEADGYDLNDDFIDDAAAPDDSDSENEVGPGDSPLKCSRCGKEYRWVT